MRIYNPGLGKFLSVDPLSRQYPWYTPYQFAGNKPIWCKDLDGAEEWYYWNEMLGWTKSKLAAGPKDQNIMNKSGYYTTNQTAAMKKSWDDEAAAIRWRGNEEKRRYDYEQGVKDYNAHQNPFYIIGRYMTPAGGIVEGIQDCKEGSYYWATFNFTTAFFEAKGLLSMFKSARIADIWAMKPFERGTAMEKFLKNWGYDGYFHTGEISQFFKGIDFWKDGLGVSLKTVNAQASFSFENIIKNIDDLVDMRSAGSISSHGTELKISEVRLDIAVPEGYDVKVLDNVKKYAEANKVEVNIFEIK
jgi:hypothetical protein